MKPILAAAAILALGISVGDAQAHHSGAMFDADHPIDIKGEVKEFRWTNPHVYVEVYGSSVAKPQPQVWSIEFTSPGNLSRRGWTKHTFQPGDKVTMTITPLREGTPGGGFRKVIFEATGKVITAVSSLRQQTSPTE